MSVDRMTPTPSSYRAPRSQTQPTAPLRPEVLKARERLRQMPPYAREREIETGRYSQFSPEEKDLLRSGD
jgi:hypothetical protein